MSSFAERISALFSNRLITSSRNRTTATIIGLLSFLGIVIGYNDYQAWKALGRGGMPYNIKGWLYQSMLRLKASNDITSTKCYDELMKQSELESRTFFSQELPVRKGAKPTMSTHIIPHRQLDHKANKGLVDSLNGALDKIVNDNDHYLDVRPSLLEGGTSDAIFIKHAHFSENHAFQPRAAHEVFHIHESEGSAHGVLSAHDAKKLIECGWGTRHPLCGRALGIPMQFIMVYAPRTLEEVGIVTTIARASVAYALEGKLELK